MSISEIYHPALPWQGRMLRGAGKALIVSDVYRASLALSGKLKLRAKARLAAGDFDDVFEACVLLHETARTERRAVAALPLCPPETRLLASIEECSCLVEGRDPPAAARVWGRILREQPDVDASVAKAMLTRLTSRYHKQQKAFAKVVMGSRTVVRHARNIVAASLKDRKRARQELAALLGHFPGAARFWWTAYRLAEAANDKDATWDALTRARRLEPNNPRFEAMSLWVSTWALSTEEAEHHLTRVRGRFDKAGAEVCLMYALAEVQLARDTKPSKRGPRWERAHRAAQAGLVQERTPSTHRNLRAVEMLVAVLLAGRKPTKDILYRADLGLLAAQSPAQADVFELLSESVRYEAA